MNARMRGENFVEAPDLAFLCDNRAGARIHEKWSESAASISECLFPCGCDPFLGCGERHAFRHMEAEPFRVVENLDSCVNEDLGSRQRTAHDHASSPACVHADSDRPLH